MVRYSAGILQCIKEELVWMDWREKKVLTINGEFHRQRGKVVYEKEGRIKRIAECGAMCTLGGEE